MKTNNELVILFGNGPNLSSPNPITWTKLLDDLCKDYGIECNIHDSKPYSMIYEEILLKSKCGEESLKRKIVEKLELLESNVIYDQLRDLKINHYITTNYDFSLEKSFKQHNYNIEYNSSLVGGAEKLYSIRTKNSIKDSSNKEIANIWHIHGDINRPKSICLGFDHYCGSVGKMRSYIQNKGYEHCEYSIEEKLKKISRFDNISWIELFYKADIHIIGLKFDFSEIDLWWILNKRARMLEKPTNKIIFHEIEEDSEKENEKEKRIAKKEFLCTFGIEYILHPCEGKDQEKYDLFYKKILEDLRLEYKIK